MSPGGKTIQIFLPDGNPRSVKIAEITSRTVQVLLVPRAKLEFSLSREELNNVGLYFLVAEEGDLDMPTVYVGEAENIGDRLKSHNRKKDFWTHVLVAVSKTQFFTKSHVKYLESTACEVIREVGRANLENGNDPTKSYVPEAVAADLADNFDTIKILIGTLGYSFLEKIVRAPKAEVLYTANKGASATGEYSEDGFTVFAGSTCTLETSPSCQAWIVKIREVLLKNGTLVEENGFLKFTKDHTFKSPSGAGGVVKGRSTNGWTTWKYKDGRTLDEVKRQS